MDNKMFCFQCQETARGTGCTVAGVCGKSAEVAAMQDLLVYVTKGLSFVATRLREEGKTIPAEVNHLVTVNLFTTITNANFDIEAIELGNKDNLPDAAVWSGDRIVFAAKAAYDEVGVLSTKDEDIRSLRELITYGLKGLSAYSKHANALLQDDPEVDAFIQSALAKTLDDSLTVDDLVALTLGASRQGQYAGLWKS